MPYSGGVRHYKVVCRVPYSGGVGHYKVVRRVLYVVVLDTIRRCVGCRTVVVSDAVWCV